ncbi:MAG: hypothetical protein RR846_09865, partial [Oscillospiraceae bacterium]
AEWEGYAETVPAPSTNTQNQTGSLDQSPSCRFCIKILRGQSTLDNRLSLLLLVFCDTDA